MSLFSVNNAGINIAYVDKKNSKLNVEFLKT